jgi:predicted DNA-binding transcriptional regulator AlpA
MSRERRTADVLPGSLPPRGLSRVESAAYIGVSPSLFDSMVRDRRMPAPKRINARVVWDRMRLDAAFAALPDEDGGPDDDPFAEVAP